MNFKWTLNKHTRLRHGWSSSSPRTHSREGQGGYNGSGKQNSSSSWACEREWRLQLTSDSLVHSAHSGSAVCSDCSTDTASQPKEQAFHPQPVPRDSGQPGTASSQELRLHDREYSPHHPYSGTADGSHTLSGGPVYPSNHDRILPSLKNKEASADGKGMYCVRGTSVVCWEPLGG